VKSRSFFLEMEHLRAAELRRALHAVHELDGLVDLSEYPAAVARLLGGLIPCQIASYNAVDPRRRRAEVAAYPAESVFEGGEEVFAAYAHQNPLVVNSASSGDGSAHCISDFMSRRELHRTELYDYVYGQVGIEYQLAVAIASPLRPGEVIGLAVGRDRRDFSRAERVLLEALRPHLRATLERLGERALAQALLAAGSSDLGDWIVLASAGAIVVRANRAAETGLAVEPGAPLPAPLRRWLISEPPPERVVIGDRSLAARLFPAAHPELLTVVLKPISPSPGPEELRALGLTRRQAEVLALVARGRQSDEIALELGLSRRTVEKHLEGVYARLGVRNRVEATARAMAIRR
jgi:DNA-binding CsgD family transcriptional regulator